MRSSIAKPKRRTQRSPEAAVYNQWYHSQEWRTLRAQHLAREPNCRMCARARRTTKANMVDHIIPHRGDRRLFLDRTNLQSLCDIHHNDKQRIEYGGRPRVPVGTDGWPIE